MRAARQQPEERQHRLPVVYPSRPLPIPAAPRPPTVVEHSALAPAPDHILKHCKYGHATCNWLHSKRVQRYAGVIVVSGDVRSTQWCILAGSRINGHRIGETSIIGSHMEREDGNCFFECLVHALSDVGLAYTRNELMYMLTDASGKCLVAIHNTSGPNTPIFFFRADRWPQSFLDSLNSATILNWIPLSACIRGHNISDYLVGSVRLITPHVGRLVWAHETRA